jgi:hypothetical protein
MFVFKNDPLSKAVTSAICFFYIPRAISAIYSPLFVPFKITLSGEEDLSTRLLWTCQVQRIGMGISLIHPAQDKDSLGNPRMFQWRNCRSCGGDGVEKVRVGC